MKFTFKKEKAETGLAAIGNGNQSVTVKLGGKECGRIQAPNWQTKDSKYGVGIMVKGGANPNCDWEWVFFKARFDDEQSARDWLNANAAAIAAKYEIHTQDD